MHTDGQVQVFHDVLGLFDEFIPRHTRRYAEIGGQMREAIGQYVNDVSGRDFPTAANSFSMQEDVLADVLDEEAHRAGAADS